MRPEPPSSCVAGAIAQTVLNLNCRSGRILGISLGSAAFNIATNVLAIPRYGATGAAITTLMTYTLWQRRPMSCHDLFCPFHGSGD